ncbi:hypothetical protein [Sphingomonas corticis]|jgi:hypothetical protein|uniref:Uncharacterized protein n=1 Tax=Sphingomonas corticis TaxID=2722791 RepID=A0ABX1CJD4_9SPHN|nr:hypothetical protein [Sphingomonas corticis]NJR78090.1 hypothetical protein [Sphingomonas corticis]
MSSLADTIKAVRTVLLLQDKLAELTRTVEHQGARLSQLANAHSDLRDRVSRLEGVIEGAAMAARQRRIEE